MSIECDCSQLQALTALTATASTAIRKLSNLMADATYGWKNNVDRSIYFLLIMFHIGSTYSPVVTEPV